MNKASLISVFLLPLLLIFFQNCAETRFQKRASKEEPVKAESAQEVEEVATAFIAQGLQDKSVFISEPVEFSVNVVSSNPQGISYKWFRNSTQLNEAGSTLKINSTKESDEGMYTVRVYLSGKMIENSSASLTVVVPEVKTISKTSPGCHTYTVPAGIKKIKVTVVGGGGGGSRATPTCAYNMLSGAGGAGVIAIINVTPGQKINYCVGKGGDRPSGGGYAKGRCGETGRDHGKKSTFGSYIVANGGERGNNWHYKGKDGRGKPPSKGGTYTVASGVKVIKAANGKSVASLGKCGGNSGLGEKGSCSASASRPGPGAGGYGTGMRYSAGNASPGGHGLVKIESAD